MWVSQMQTMQIAAVHQLRALPSLGVQSSGLFGDVKTTNFTCLPPKEASRIGLNVRATYSRPGGPNAPLPSRTGQQPAQFQQSTAAPPPTAPSEAPKAEDPLAGLGTDDNNPGELPTRASAAPPRPPSSKLSTPARPPTVSPGFTGALGLNFPGSQIPGLPGSPRPKPGTPRPYDPTKQKSKVMEWLTPPPPPTELLQREHFKLSDTCACTIYFGDLSKWTVDGRSDAVIAPANKRLNTGPAVNAVLFKAAGSRMLDTTQRLPDVAPQGIKAEVGDAISTRAFNLSVSRVIHTVGPVYKKDEATGTRPSDVMLEKAYKTALGVAKKENLKFLAFPPLSCRIYGYPYSEGAEVALRTLKENCEGFERIDIVIRNIEGYEAFIDEANKALEVVKEKKTIKVPSMTPRTGDPGLPPAAEVAASEAQAPPAPTAAVEAPPAPAAAADALSVSAAETRLPVAATGAPPVTAAEAQASSLDDLSPEDRLDYLRKQIVSRSPESVAPPPPLSSTSAPPPPQYQSGPPPSSQYQGAPAPPQQQYRAPAPPRYQNAPPQYGNAPPQYQQQYNQNEPPPQNAPPQYQQQYNQNAPPQYQQQQYNQNAPPQYQQQQYNQNASPPPRPPLYNQNTPPQYQNAQAPPQYQNAPAPPPQYNQNTPQQPPQQQYQAPPPPPQQQYQPPPPPQQQYEPPPPPQQQYQPPPPPQQQYEPPPPPPSPESAPIPPRQRASPYPPSGPPPKPPSTPTTSYNQPMY